VNSILDKLNLFLAVASKVDFEAIFNEYEAAVVNLNRLDGQYTNANKQKGEIDAALSASVRLSSQNVSTLSDLEATKEKLTEEQKKLQIMVTHLREKVTIARSALSFVSQKAKDLRAIHKLH
jgi:predicted  nucleic acid-binding Zn-ribbon protein